MPKYTFRFGGNKIGSVKTNQSIAETVERTLAGSSPQTFVDGGGNIDKNRWQEQEHTREKLLEYKRIRESGGPVASLLEAKSLLTFGTGNEFQTDDEEFTEWLEDAFDARDLLFLDIGQDGFTYPGVPAEIVETRSGGFSHVELIEPWTIIPQTDEKGKIQGFVQVVEMNGQEKSRGLPKEDIAYFVLNKSCGRDETGISLLERNRDEIERFYDNQESIKNSSQLHGFPQRHIKVGREGSAPPNDNELRRLRSRFSKKWSELTMFVTGRDVEMDTLEASEFDYQNLTENDMKILTLSFLMPQELGNVGSDGLGSGMPAELRYKLLELNIQSKQKMLARQFIEQVVRPVVRDYSGFDHTQKIELNWDPLEDDLEDEVQRALDMEDYLTSNEVREAGNYEPIEDESVGESYDSPGQEDSNDGMGGLFNRSLADPLTENHQLGPLEGDLYCENEGSSFETSEIGDDDECPWCGDPVSVFGKSELSGDSGNSNPGDRTLQEYIPEGTEEWERSLLERYSATWDVETDKRLVSFSDAAMPEFAKARIRDAILGGALFSDFEGIPGSELMDLRQTFADTLTEDGWTIDMMRDELLEFEPSLSKSDAETIARTETAATLNSAREEGYREMGQEDALFYWTGNLDGNQTEACEWLINETNPNHSGTPVGIDELKELIDEAPSHDDEMPNDLARPDSFVVHPNERKTWVRYVE